MNDISPLALEIKLREFARIARIADEEWVEANETYEILKDAKDEYFGSIVDKQEGKHNTEKERAAYRTEEWKKWMIGFQEARRIARKLKVLKDAAQRDWETTRSVMSSKNAGRLSGT